MKKTASEHNHSVTDKAIKSGTYLLQFMLDIESENTQIFS